MSILVGLSRSNFNQPWGFRITGGRDFHKELEVLKVTANSLASKNGLTPGDKILKINNNSTAALTHKEAEELIINLNQVDLEVVKAGQGTTWKPDVRVLESNLMQEGGPETGGATLVNKQFNTPIKIYSEQAIAETLSAQSEVLAGGAIGVNFKKNEKKYNYEDSEVYKMLQEVERGGGGGGSENEQPSPGIVRIAAPSSQHHFGPQIQQGQGQQLIQQQVRLQQGQQQQQQPQQSQQGQQFTDPRAGKVYEPVPVTIPPVNLKPVAVAPAPVTAPVSAPVTGPQTGQGPPGTNPNVCADCERLIVGVFVRIKDKNLHVDCFKCSTCGQSLKNVGYYNINNKLYCDIHAKTVARANPPGPGLEPFTVPPAAAQNSPGLGGAATGGFGSPGIGGPAPGFGSPGLGLAGTKPFSYTGGAPAGPAPISPGVDSYASKVAPLPYHHSPSGGISHVTAPKSPQQLPGAGGFQQQPSFQPIQPLAMQPMQPMQPIQPPAGYQPLLAQQQQGFQSNQSYETSCYKKSSSFSEQTISSSSTTSGSQVVWPPGGSAAAPLPVTGGVSPQQQKFKQQQVPYKPLATLLQTAGGNKPTAPQTYAAPPQAAAQPAYSPIQPISNFSAAPQQPASNYSAPPPQQQPYSPIQPSFQPANKPSFTPIVNKPTFTPPKQPAFGAGSGAGAGAGAGLKSSQSTTLANRISRGILTQPSARQAVCGACHKQIRGPFITAGMKFYCPEHFKCGNQTCKRDLIEIGFVEEKSNLYCEFCWESQLAPLCNKCNKRIKYESLNAIGQHFHQECFKCKQCGKVFGTEAFFLEDGEPYCDKDWNELFTTKCHGCGFPIEAGDRWVEAMNQNYHSQCFNCSACKKNLEGQSFFAKAGRPFCKSHAR